MYTLIAQSINLGPGGGQFGGLTNITLQAIISAAIQFIFIITAIILLAVLLFGGITVMTSGGDKQKTASGQAAITAAIIGLLIVFGAWAIINLINLFFGVNILTLNIPNAQTNI